MINLRALRKGIYPWPVFEAHFTDGTMTRMSFWSKAGQPIDAETGKRINLKLTKNQGKTYSHGFIETAGVRLDAEANDELSRAMTRKRRNYAGLVIAAKGALAALSQPATHPADVAAARKWLKEALEDVA